MKKMKFSVGALLAVLMVTLTSCLGKNDNSNIALNMADFMYVRDNGTQLVADDAHTFSVQNPAALRYKDGTTPDRVFVQLWVEVPQGMDIQNVYDTPNYPVTVMSAVRCYENNMISKEDAPEKSNMISGLQASVNTKKLNIYFQSVVADDATGKEFNCYVKKIDGDKVELTFQNSLDSKSGYSSFGAVSYPILDLINAIKKDVKPNEKNEIMLVINDMQTLTFTMPVY